MKTCEVWVWGRVQGIFFRKTCYDAARSLAIHGYVKNHPDGRVYICLQGDEDKIYFFLSRLPYLNSNAQIEEICVGWSNKDDCGIFQIKY